MIEFRRSDQIFNSSFETGIRSLCALSIGHPHEYDIDRLLAFDHIIVHSGDIPGGPPSLHPKVQQRNGELLVRRPLIQNGLALMATKGLVSTRISNNRIVYAATEFAPVFLDSLENKYVRDLLERAQWAVTALEEWGQESFFRVFNAAFGRWSSEFQIADVSLGGVQS